MAYVFFYISIVLTWALLLICTHYRAAGTPHTVIAITTAAISLLYDLFLGEYLRLYYYIHPQFSVLYIILAGFLIYPPVNVIYTLFLPDDYRSTVMYTILWIAAMMVFEYASIWAKTIVFTGWSPFPWSPVTYIVTYLWINLLFRYLKKSCYKLTMD